MRRFLGVLAAVVALTWCGWAGADEGGPAMQVWYCGCADASWVHTGGKLACPCTKPEKDCTCKHELRATYKVTESGSNLKAAAGGDAWLALVQVVQKDGKAENAAVAGATAKGRLVQKVKGFVCPMKQCLPEGQSETVEKCPKCGMKMKEGMVEKACGAEVEGKFDGEKVTFKGLEAPTPGNYELVYAITLAEKVVLKGAVTVTAAQTK